MDLTKTWAQLRKVVGGVYTQLDVDNYADSNLDTVYETHVIMDGEHVEVWWGPEDGDLSLILETNEAPILTGNEVDFVSYPNTVAYWDDIDFKTEDPSTTVFAYNTANELTKLTENGVDTTFTYNDWGRTVSKQKTVGQTTYMATYGYLYGDKLKSVASDFPGEAGEVAYNYDGLGKRRNKLVNDTDVTWWRWDAGWGMIAEYGQAGSWTVGDRQMSYTLLGMSALADVAGANPGQGDYRYYAQDHLGSLRALFDGDGTQIGMAEYEPYGMIRTGAGPADTPGQTFTGKMLDVETMLYYFPFRYYSPMTARWMTRDPLGMVDGPNLYGYVGGNAVNAMDVFGLWKWCPREALNVAWECGWAIFDLVSTGVGCALCAVCIVTLGGGGVGTGPCVAACAGCARPIVEISTDPCDEDPFNGEQCANALRDWMKCKEWI